MKVELTTVGGKYITIELPESPEQVRLNKYIDLNHGFNKILEWVVEQENEGELFNLRTYYAYKLAQLLSEYFEVDIMDLLNLPAEDLLDDTGQLMPGVLKDHIVNMKEGSRDNVPEVTGTLFSILEYLDHVILKYEPKLIGSFTYKKQEWVVPELRILSAHNIQYPKLTVIQAIEAMEVERSAKEMSAQGDDDGSALYSSILHRMALLCSKKGEVFEVDNFHNRVASRREYFKDITMDIALDVLFFSQHILENYLKSTVTNTFSDLRHPDQD